MKLNCTVFAIILMLACSSQHIKAQSRIDSLFLNKDSLSVIDSLMKDFDSYLDSLSSPKSFFNVSVGIGTGMFSFENNTSTLLTTEKKLIISPSIGYYHKSGLGFSATGYMINDNQKLIFYQYVLSPSFDVIKRNFSTGFSFSKYINKDSLTFYTTPIQNELFAYFSYKNWWLRPSINISYGWGSKTEFEKKQYTIYRRLLQQSNRYYVTIRNEESVNDFSITLSARKDFNWYDVIQKRDNITLTPAVIFNSGTQKFGFNTSYTYSIPAAIRVSPASRNTNQSERDGFAAQSVSAIIRCSYSIKKFIVQPQVLFDYYLPQSSDPLNTAFSVTAGFSF